MANLTAVVRVLSWCAMGLAALPAVAQSLPTYPLPTDLHYLSTSGPGPVNPAVIVGFNPQPDPPGFGDVVDLRNPMDPSIAFRTVSPVTTTILFGMHGASPSDGYAISPGLFTDNRDGTASYVFAEAGDGSVFKVTFDISGFTGGWSSFNPQPDPPGDNGFVFVGDPMFTWHIDLQLANGGLAPLAFVPEPASLGILLMGLGTLIGLRRKAAG
jgi:PEP-CTERM motif